MKKKFLEKTKINLNVIHYLEKKKTKNNTINQA